MEVLASKPFNYAVLAEGEQAFIAVVCGTSALYEVWVRKTRAEALALLADEATLNAMVEAVRGNPGRFNSKRQEKV
jgi:uncharacterized protein YbjQ (UPF0145 family)